MNAYLTRRNADHHKAQRKEAIRAWHEACDRQDAEMRRHQSRDVSQDAADAIILCICILVILAAIYAAFTGAA